MAEAILKRPLDIEEVVVPEKTRKVEEEEEDSGSTLADFENLTLYAGLLINAPDKKKSVTEADFTNHTPRVKAINRPEDDRTQTLSGFHLTDGEDSYILPIELIRKWPAYDVGSRRIYSPIPLLKYATNMSVEHDHELSRGVSKKDTLYSPEQIEVLRTAFLTEEGREMCKEAGEEM
jgi:hypothetical protein